MEIKRTRLVWYPVWLWAAVAFTGVGLICSIYKWLQIRSLRFVVTDNTVRKESGFFKKQIVEIPINEITFVGVKQGVIEKTIGFGDIYLGSISGKQIVMRHVREPGMNLGLITDNKSFAGNTI